MEKESIALERLCDPKSKVSSHYFIRRNGELIKLVPDLYEAWHAGISSWKNYKSLNKYSLGIEISNPGHNFDYKNFSNNQIKTLQKILKFLINKYKIKIDNILGHSDIAPNRKKDPGEKFPWQILAKKKLCKWHNLNILKIKKYRGKKETLENQKIFMKNLCKIGYQKLDKKSSFQDKKKLVIAFQRRFRQHLINGIIDKECFLICKSILQ